MDDPATRASQSPDTNRDRVLGGRYIAEHLVARGGMALVYQGRDTVLDRPVAIKILRADPEARRGGDFLNEARATANLKHPNIVDVYDAGIDNGDPYIVMEYVPGDTLRDLIARAAPLDPFIVAMLGAQIAEALAFAHQQGIVHCDIKPSNVLLPDDDTPKLVDFGIAHAMGATMTLTESIVGTAAYISPEQVEGIRPDGRADVYSLGVVLYEMLVGAPPFTGRTLAAVATQRLTQATVPPTQRNPEVPPELSAIVMRALERDRENRYPSARDFAIALRLFADRGDTRANTRRAAAPTPFPLPRTGPTRRAEAEDEGMTQARTRAIPRPTNTRPPAQRRTPWAIIAGVGAVLAVAVAGIVLILSSLGNRASMVTVPQVTNRPVSEAADALHGAGLNVASPIDFTQSPQPFGTVIRQSPAAGTRLATKSDIQLTVSVGP